VRLTDLSLKSLRPPQEGQRTYTDDALPGFGVRISQGGSRTFVLVHGPTRRRETIGRFPPLTLQEARAEARRRLAQYTLGKLALIPITVEDAVAQFIAAAEKRNKPRTVRDYRRLLKRHFNLGTTRLGDVTATEIQRRLDRLSATPNEQNHAFTIAQIFFRYSVAQGWLDRNPYEGMSLPNRTTPRDRVLADAEIAAVWRAADGYGYPFGTIVQLCILTGQRRSEIGRLRWDYLDPEPGSITLPAAETKNNRQHTFPLGPTAASIVRSIDRGSPYLFPARRDFRMDMPSTVYNSWAKDKRAFDRMCPIAHWTLHDLRRTFSTNLAGLNTPPHVLERILNHSSGTISGVAAIYNRFRYMEEMRAAIEAWEGKLARLIEAPSV
jgi:integrase